MPELSEKKIKYLELMANTLRQDVVEMLALAGSGHSAGSLGMADIFSALYFFILNHNPKKPNWPDRDFLLLSNGHICPILYASLARAGYFPLEELKTLRKLNSRLEGHPHRGLLPGVEISSGPLGSGLSEAIGIALSLKIDKKKNHVFCLMSDGEQNCGNTWEAVMLAGKYHLNNLTAFIDRNNIQISGFTENVMPIESLRRKYESFNWQVLEIDGHNLESIVDAINEAKAIFERPTVIIAHTIPGKGVDFMESDFTWHGKSPTEHEAKIALKKLRTLSGRLEEE
ncbi:MAG: transketolase [Candidatus Pacebacteria bacterium]|nr:transketolase [Candidatus Paceibacterota bacterium]